MPDFFDAFNKPPADRPPATVHTLPRRAGNPYAAAALRNEAALVAGAPEGTRNHTLNTAAFKLAGLIADGHLDYTDVHDTLTHAAQQAGLQPGEIAATLKSGLGAGQQHPRAIPGLDPIPTATILTGNGQTPEEYRSTLAQWVTEHLPRVDWHQLWEQEDDEEWIVEPILPARRLVAFYSAPKVGKSLLMLELAVAVARGTAILGTTPDRPRRILYVDFENDPRGDIRERLTDMRVGPGDLDNLVYLTYPTLAKLDTPRGGQELMAAITHYQCEVVIIDTVSRSIQGDENENDTWLDFYRETGLLLKQAGIALIRLDHSGKDAEKGMRGGSAKYGDVDAVWKMSKLTEDSLRLDCEANRMQVTEKTLVLHREIGPLRHRVDSLGRSAVWDLKTKAVIDAADAAGLPADASNKDVRDAARAAGVRARNEAIAEAVKRRKLAFPAGLGNAGNAFPVDRGTD